MSRTSKRSNPTFVWAILLCSVLAAGLAMLAARWKRDSANQAIGTAIVTLKNAGHAQGRPYWTGDVTGLYRMGLISRAMAEADAAPLVPLVSSPRAFHGYLFVAMNTGPSMTDHDEPVKLKGDTNLRDTYAICAYPDQDGPSGRKVYLVCPFGMFSKISETAQPVLEWPGTVRELKSNWSIID